jgi:putrescine aminotransferase
LPDDGYLQSVKELCTANRSLYIADEVQTGLGRSGKMWAFQTLGVDPDIVVVGKGLSGGMYPISATLLGESAGRWLSEDGWAHVSTFGGAELGCAVALKSLEITSRASTVAGVEALSSRLASELGRLTEMYAFLLEVRQCGLIIGLKFDDPMGGMKMSKALYDRGVWAMFAGFDRSVIQFKPGLLLSDADADELLGRLEDTLKVVSGG